MEKLKLVLLKDIEKANMVISGKIFQTPLIYSPYLSNHTECEVYLKLENLQNTGSFKVRGATYIIQTQLNHIASGGVIAASAGNHAQGVALAALDAGVPATIIMPKWASIMKQEATRIYGANVILDGNNISQSIERAKELASSGMTFIHPFDDPLIIAGQGTIALEIFNQLPDPDFIIVPIGGGGLIGGIATATKSIRSETTIIGVQANACPSAYLSQKLGSITSVEAKKTIADGIAVKQPGITTFQIIKEKVDRIVLVNEEEIAHAVLTLLEHNKILAEGAAAVSVGALLDSSISIPKGSRVVLVISGGNVDTPLLDRILGQGLRKNERIIKFSVYLDDRPGSLSKLLRLISKNQANVLHIFHIRNEKDLPIYQSRVGIELETRNKNHIIKITNALKNAGYYIEF